MGIKKNEKSDFFRKKVLILHFLYGDI
jgi:hypothetical protein